VLSGTIVLRLGERTILVLAGEAAEFSTMEPHAFGALEEAAEVLCILDHDGTRTHLGPRSPLPDTGPEQDGPAPEPGGPVAPEGRGREVLVAGAVYCRG